MIMYYILEIENLSFEYIKGKKVLEDINLSCKKDEKLGVIGCNGAGKSTLLKLMVGLDKIEYGKITISGLEVCKKNLSLIRQKAGFVFQDADNQLFMPTVEDDIAFGPYNYGLRGAKLKEVVHNVMDELGIAEIAKNRITNLSGGEKKMVSLATVMVLKPDVLIFDEPTIALDPGNRRKLINCLKALYGAQIIASHDLDMIWDVCSRVILMKDGKIIAEGTTQEILSDKKLLEGAGLELPLRFQ